MRPGSPPRRKNGCGAERKTDLQQARVLGLHRSVLQVWVHTYSLDINSFTIGDFQNFHAITLPRDLGHELGGLPADATSPKQSTANTKTEIDNCSPHLMLDRAEAMWQSLGYTFR